MDHDPTVYAQARPGERVVSCPQCRGDSVYAPRNPFRPFCSARCKGVDFGAWASEAFRVPNEAPPEDGPYGDPRLQ
ncbi:DNA gyrase inhibitor YacG [Xylophilus sp. ASV27]|uniref:DNA gyrase inhibitor YacG n=1 Tax=Xylophilus sp. ASV27 TaxID=2795129 RepID=UPI0018EC51FC|nr:DNA gyrase inhibitor YacG [Xylophilus sp. ASV27]